MISFPIARRFISPQSSAIKVYSELKICLDNSLDSSIFSLHIKKLDSVEKNHLKHNMTLFP